VWGSGSIVPHVHNLHTRWRSVVGFTPRPLYPGERPSDIHLIGDRVGSRASLDDMEKRKFLTPPRLEPLGSPAYSQSLYRLFYRGSIKYYVELDWDILACSLLKVTCFHAGFWLALVSGTEDGGDMFLRNVCWP
jgi:hypothetical protein